MRADGNEFFEQPRRTFNLAPLASTKLAGAARLLSFDETLKARAVTEGLAIFPPLALGGKRLLAKLRA